MVGTALVTVMTMGASCPSSALSANSPVLGKSVMSLYEGTKTSDRGFLVVRGV